MKFMDSVLIIGGGAREHALLKALLRSDRPLCTYAWPGNPGMENDGCMLVDASIKTWSDLAVWAVKNSIDLTIVGPEQPLVEGIVDLFRKKRLTIFGPSQAASQLEGSKHFAKTIMAKYGIPTAAFTTVSSQNEALDYIEKQGLPLVIKVSGLAAGKGAIVCDSRKDALEALERIYIKNEFGDAAAQVIIEEKMEGEEASVFVLSDGKNYKVLPVAQDHKRIGDNDTGPNTGGMGAYAPAPLITPELLKTIESSIIKPTLDAMVKEGSPYRGLLYVGIMMTASGPRVVEYNCRFGDPETQAVLPLVECDWFDVFCACADGRLGEVSLTVKKGACAVVVLASQGYPGSCEKGLPISGIEDAEGAKSNVDVYHAGTALKDGMLVTNGGRVLSVTAWSESLEKAIKVAYDNVKKINFEGKTFRTDIGAKGLSRKQ